MYPNLYYVFKDWFGVEWKALSFLNTFGLMVALAFVAAAVVLSAELKRKEKLGLLFPREEILTVGKPASLYEIISNWWRFIVCRLTGFFKMVRQEQTKIKRTGKQNCQDLAARQGRRHHHPGPGIRYSWRQTVR